MYPISPEFIEAIQNGAEVITRADLYRFNDKVMELPILGGTVTDDSGAAVRRRATLQVAAGYDASFIPAKVSRDDKGLWPIGSEVRLFQGVKHTDHSLGTEMVPMGVFRIARPVVQDNGSDLVLTIDGYDRSRALSRARFTDSYQIANGTDLATAIKDMWQHQVGWLTDDMFKDEYWMRTDGYFASKHYWTPQLTFDRTGDPWAEAKKMAASSGLEVFFNTEGYPVLRVEPNPLTDPAVYEYLEGEANTATNLSRDLDDETAYNGVIVTGENSTNTTIPRAEVWDTNPESPTYYDPAKPWDSSYGPVPTFITSQYIARQEQADDAAVAEFGRLTGILENVRITAVPNFAHESHDVIAICRNRINVDSKYILESFTVGLGESGMLDGVTRSRGVS